MRLTKCEARRFLLSHQRLACPRSLVGKQGILDFVQRVGCIQFDPIDMVGGNAHLVLQSRVGQYRPEMLAELLYRDRKLLDGWDKNMSIYPIEDWPFFARYRSEDRERYEHRVSEALGDVRKAINETGPINSSAVSTDAKVRWPWGPTSVVRAALEAMYFWGELGISNKTHTRKSYDLVSRLLSPDLLAAPDQNPTLEDFFSWCVYRRVGSIGLLWNRAGDAWLGIRWFKSRDRDTAFARLEKNQQLVPVEVEGIRYPCFVRHQDLPALEESIRPNDRSAGACFIAPLDNLIWDRKLVSALFGFEYTWEVYKPAPERAYGYYVLPVLYGDQFVARFEPRFDRKKKRLYVLNWWWEQDTKPHDDMALVLAQAARDFVVYLGAESVECLCEDPESRRIWSLC